MQYNTIQCNTIQYNTVQYNTIQYNTILRIFYMILLHDSFIDRNSMSPHDSDYCCTQDSTMHHNITIL